MDPDSLDESSQLLVVWDDFQYPTGLQVAATAIGSATKADAALKDSIKWKDRISGLLKEGEPKPWCRYLVTRVDSQLSSGVPSKASLAGLR